VRAQQDAVHDPWPPYVIPPGCLTDARDSPSAGSSQLAAFFRLGCTREPIGYTLV